MLSKVASSARVAGRRSLATSSGLKERLQQLVPQEQAKFKKLKADHGDKVLGQVTVEQALGGARDVQCLVWETSLLDAQEGIRFRGMTIPELQKALPPASGKKGDEPGPAQFRLRGAPQRLVAQPLVLRLDLVQLQLQRLYDRTHEKQKGGKPLG